MADVFVEYDAVIAGADGTGWLPRACGRVGSDGLWEGWIEFVSSGSAEPVRTQRETQQPNRDALMYWAQGLTHVYLQEALVRALTPARVPPPAVRAAAPFFDGPAPRRAEASSTRTTSHAVLNPFAVYQQGEDVLARELSALHPPRLRDIVVDYGFAPASWADGKSREELTTAIMVGVRNPPRAQPPEAVSDGASEIRP